MKLTLVANDSTRSLRPSGMSVCQVDVCGPISQRDSTLIEPLRNLVGSFSGRRILLDLRRATSVDSSGIGWLLACRRGCLESRGELVLLATPPAVIRALKLLNVSDLFKMVSSLKASSQPVSAVRSDASGLSTSDAQKEMQR